MNRKEDHQGCGVLLYSNFLKINNLTLETSLHRKLTLYLCAG